MILKMLHDFEQGLENLRSWMDMIETNLQKPFSLNTLNANDLRIHQQSIAVCRMLTKFKYCFLKFSEY
jgi:hypothetical protein